MPVESLLEAGGKQLGIQLSDGQLNQYEQYTELLQKWSSTFNLTAIQDKEAIAVQHLLDCLAVAKHLQGEHFIDVGTGAGLPGLVLAIYQPDWQLTLIDSLVKRCRFLHQACTELKLVNVNIYHARIEDHAIEFQGTQAIITRAFATLSNMLRCCTINKELTQGLILYAMKGRFPQDEIEAMTTSFPRAEIQKTLQLEVPYLNAERHLLQIAIKC